MDEASAGLGHLRVAEIGEGVAIGYAAKLLVDQGARVVKVERPGGDPLRHWNAADPDGPPPDPGALFAFLAAGKRSVTATAASVERVLAWADVVLLGPTADELHAGWLLEEREGSTEPGTPNVVRIVPFRVGGPFAGLPNNEFTLQAWCGIMSTNGYLDSPPLQLGIGPGAWSAGAAGALAAVGVAESAARTGRSTTVEVSILELMSLCLTNYPSLYREFLGRKPFARGRADYPLVVRCADGWIGLCLFTAQQWSDFAAMIGRDDLSGDERFQSIGGRVMHREEVRGIVDPWLADHTAAEIHELCQLFRIPVAFVGTGSSVLEMSHFRERGVFLENPAGFRQPRRPFRMSAVPDPPIGPAPAVGADDDVILEERRRTADATGAGADATGAGADSADADAADASDASAVDRRPLAGVRVLDLTAFWAGPITTHLLRALGADVVKIESHRRPDGMRTATSSRPDQPDWLERSPTFHAANPGKRSVTIDFSSEAGRELLLRLVERADVVVENFTPRVLDNARLTEDVLRARRPDVIVCRIPGYGLDGPWRDFSGWAYTMEQVSGYGWLNGEPDREPITNSTIDPITGYHAAFAICSALAHRRRTGEGQVVEVPMAEVALNVAADGIVTASAYGVTRVRAANRGPGAAPQGVYPCAGDDQWIAVSIEDDEQWAALVRSLGSPMWALDRALASRAARREHHDEIDKALAHAFVDQPRDEVVARLLAAGVTCAPVWDSVDIDALSEIVAADFFTTLTHPTVGPVAYPGTGLRSPDFSLDPTRPAPCVGEHTAEVLEELLDLGPDARAKLAADGVIGPT
jgi:crotonobetainyl-CoA:carnitine CoA-transferase CaiB-like acyl-CoA transferase